MARPQKTDQQLLVSVLERYFAEVVFGDPSVIRFTDLEKYAASQGISAKEYEFRRNKAVRARMAELQACAGQEDQDIGTLAYKSLDIEGMIRNCRDLTDLKKKMNEVDSYWKSIYDRCVALSKDSRAALVQKADFEKRLAEMQKETDHLNALYENSEKENNGLRRENAYLRRMLEKYLYPDLARHLMKEEHLPVDGPRYVTKEALTEMVEGKQPLDIEKRITDRSEHAKRALEARDSVYTRGYDKRAAKTEGLGRDIGDKLRYSYGDDHAQMHKRGQEQKESTGITSGDLKFDSKAVVNGIIMSEILGKPKSKQKSNRKHG